MWMCGISSRGSFNICMQAPLAHYYSRFMAPNPIKWITSNSSRIWIRTPDSNHFQIAKRLRIEHRRRSHYQYQSIHGMRDQSSKPPNFVSLSSLDCALGVLFLAINSSRSRPWQNCKCQKSPNLLSQLILRVQTHDRQQVQSPPTTTTATRPQETPPYSLENISRISGRVRAEVVPNNKTTLRMIL